MAASNMGRPAETSRFHGGRHAGLSTSKCLQNWVVGGPTLFAVLAEVWYLLWGELVPLGKVGVTCQDMKDN